MRQFTPAARVWAIIVILVAACASLAATRSLTADPAIWFGAVLLGCCAAVAHFFPIHSSSNQTSNRMTTVFIIAGIIILPVNLLLPLTLLAIVPEQCGKARDGLLRCLFSCAHTLLAAYAAAFAIELYGTREMSDVGGLLTLLCAALVFIVVHNGLNACFLMLQHHTTIGRVDALRLPVLLTDGVYALMGVMLAGMWYATPLLALLVLPGLILVYNMTRNAHLAAMAHLDPKTGLHNSRYFERLLAEELGRSGRTDLPVSLLFIDLDRFKMVNDAHGHAAGDQVLLEVAEVMRGTIRRGDTIARFGGEEFVVLLPGAYSTMATYLAEEIRAAVEGHSFVLDNGNVVRCTISVGVATSPDDGMDVRSLLARADWTMYQAKQTRNSAWRPSGSPLVGRSVPRRGVEGQPPEVLVSPAEDWRSRIARLVIWATVVAGGVATLVGLLLTYRMGIWLAVPPFIVLAVAAEFFPVQVYRANRERLTISLTGAVIMAVVAIQPFAAPLVNIAAALVHVLSRRQRRLDKALFNLTNPALAAACASGVYVALRPAHGGFSTDTLLASIASVLTFYAVNTGVVSLMISLHSKRPFPQVVREGAWFAPITILLGLTGAFVATVHAELGPIGAAMFAVPVLLLAFTLTFAAKKSEQAIAALEAAKAEAEHAHGERGKTLRQLIEMVASIIDARDNLVWGHSRNVAKYGALIARVLELPADQVAAIRTAGMLHDLGKVAIPEMILHKPGRLTAEEYMAVQQHPATGKRILSEVELLHDVAQMVGDHHERFDGTGYPRGKEGEEISIGGRILSVADTLDTIVSDRSYADAQPLSAALEEIDRCAGSQFDPAVVAALHRIVADRGVDFFSNSAIAHGRDDEEYDHPQIIVFPTPQERSAKARHNVGP